MRFRRERGRWVHPATHTISKFFPANPPERSDTVLVDGARCRVLRCPVEWNGREWRMTRGVRNQAFPFGDGRSERCEDCGGPQGHVYLSGPARVLCPACLATAKAESESDCRSVAALYGFDDPEQVSDDR